MLDKRNMSSVWLTDFCSNLRIFTSIILIQIAVMIYAFSFLSFDLFFIRKLSILTLLAQLTGLTLLVLLCKMRNFLNGLGVIKGVAVLILLIAMITSLVVQTIGYLDLQLNFDLLNGENSINHLNVKLTVSSILICTALIRYFYIQDQWTDHIKQLSEAKLNALQARIKPHFLFNSLNSIASLVSFDANKAEQAITDFSGLMRRAFAHQDKLITLSEEIKWVEQYLRIEKLRLDSRLDYEIQCEAELKNQKVPVLCLQPLVENAILHGIQPLEEGGTIEINIFKRKNVFLIHVCNPYISDLITANNGIALKNIKQRLALQYGHKAQMHIDKTETHYNIILTLPL